MSYKHKRAKWFPRSTPLQGKNTFIVRHKTFSLAQQFQARLKPLPGGNLSSRFGPIFPPCRKHFTKYIHPISSKPSEIHLLRSGPPRPFPCARMANNDIKWPPQMHGDLTAVYQFCYLRWTSGGGVFSSECGGRRSRGTPAVKYLVKLFIDLGRKRYSQSCASSRAGEPFDEEDLSAQTVIPDTHHTSSRPTR